MPISLLLGRLGAAAGVAALLGVLVPGQAHAAAPRIVQDRLAPVAMAEGVAAAARLTVHASSCTTVKTLGVAVRDEAENNLDFPGAATDVRVCRGATSVTTGSRTLPPGTYTVFGYWQDDADGWHDLPARRLTVTPAAGAGSPAVPGQPSVPGLPHLPGIPGLPGLPGIPDQPTPGGGSGGLPPFSGTSLVWSDEFDSAIAWGSRWTGDRTSSYRYGDHNPDDNKLDWLSTGAVSVADGVATFTARPSDRVLENGRQAWETGLLTTEYSDQGFQVRTGDYVETRVRLPEGQGAWPALWTWKNGNGEVDSFEYHPDNPNLLELSNRVRRGAKYYRGPADIGPGQWVTIGTYYGSRSVEWYVNGSRVYSDRAGVGPRWSAYLILNLSVVAGNYHPAPESAEPLEFAADYVRVYR
ncbi:hypothetical protein [Kitasatospora sp. NPDC059571]|uniref:hypothetical protein n=1 Tax=Kitasatospora sp. NPDC059571 TaxID=3346871 RepID=UPI003697D3AB